MSATAISSIRIHRQWQPFRDGTYRCSGGRSAEGFDSTIVEITSRDGQRGYGEMAPLGSFYDPAFAEGARAAMRELAPQLLGADASGVEALNRRMDLLLKGHPYAKSAIDMALWDLAGKHSGLSLASMSGGAEGDSLALYRSIAQQAPDAMAARAQKYIAEGYRRLQVKVGLDVNEDIARLEAVRAAIPSDTVLFCDANASWGTSETRQFLMATGNLDYTLEQPCASYEENLAIRRACERPLVLDETIDGADVLLRAIADGLVDGITIKLARVGGLTKAKLVRDIAIARNLKITIEDTGGAEIDTAAYCGLMLSTPEILRQHTVDFHNWVTVSNAKADFRIADGEMTLPSGPGLGVEVDIEALGEPIFQSAL
ncbi:mandelate racemase/muconate lactonizing enzyme family protein [Mesorhizobium sp. ZC-5]|uniref:mandelate racemase/muconate lactonizing enzyme family protein n=1 Tax=Mesorhizobium sp. ZC-5 TaxID=2986066 RepID=UPI0021E9089E|nr:mandelate racemase/muconate lactonizing enzyme family protein [Mesorhizobium sp. ZC-5]MCV3242298.1 mandelate racemase/muconate lactonizing enzyme family protein [Mesorhizobium sp. ZC-5]